MRTLIVKKTELTSTETFIFRHAHDLEGQTLLLHGQPPRSEQGVTYEIATPRRLALRVARKLGRSSEEGLNDRRYLRALRDFEPDVVLAEFGPAGVALNAPCRKLGIPLVCFFHGYDLYVDKVRHAHLEGYRRLFSDAAALVCGARSMREFLLKEGAPARRTFVSESSGIDCRMFGTDGADGGADAASGAHGADAASGADSEENRVPRFVHVGRFVDKKGPHLTLLAFAAVLDEEPEARLDMVGDGRLLGACIDLAAALGIDSAVTFHGLLPHARVVEVLNGARGFVQHSMVAHNGDREGTGLAALEAGAARMPAVVTRHAGFLDTVVEGETGFLVDERDVDAMADRMLFLARNPEHAARMGARARRRVEHYFDHEKSIRRLASILEWAAGRRRVRPAFLPAWASREVDEVAEVEAGAGSEARAAVRVGVP